MSCFFRKYGATFISIALFLGLAAFRLSKEFNGIVKFANKKRI